MLLVTVVVLYLLFVITNTMFSSKKDMDSAWIVVLFLTVLTVSLYILGLNPQALAYDFFSQNTLISSAGKVVRLLSIPIVINLTVLLASHIIKRETLK